MSCIGNGGCCWKDFDERTFIADFIRISSSTRHVFPLPRSAFLGELSRMAVEVTEDACRCGEAWRTVNCIHSFLRE